MTGNEGVPVIFATWSIALNCDCPACKEFVNLLDYADFWDCHTHLKIAEHGTERSRNVEVNCPDCGHDFIVDLEY